MAKGHGEIYQLTQNPDLIAVIREMNGILSRISSRLNELQGIKGESEFSSNINMNNHRVINLSDPVSENDAQKKALALSRPSTSGKWDAKSTVIGKAARATADDDLPTLAQVRELQRSGSHIFSTTTPLEVESVGSVGTENSVSRGDHVHPGVNLTDAQTIGGAKTFSAKATFSAEVEIDGALNHDGSTAGFFAGTPATQPTAYTQTYSTASKTHENPTAVDFTDNSGGTASDTIAAITGGGAGCEDATKNAIASLARQSDRLVVDVANVKQVLNQVIDDLQSLSLFAT